MIGRKKIISRLTMCKKKNIDLEVKTQELTFKDEHTQKTYNIHDGIIVMGQEEALCSVAALAVIRNDLGLPCTPRFGRQAGLPRMDETTKLEEAEMDRHSTSPWT